MRRRHWVILCVCLATGALAVLLAQGQKRASPHEKVSATVDGKTITIEYGRPYKKGREIFGGLVPWGQVWRTGADEATVLTTDADLMIGSLHIPKGTYSVFTIPNQNEWTLIINKTAKQWGAFKYDQGTDLGRTTMKVRSNSSPVEQFTITLTPKGSRACELAMMWDRVVAEASIMVH